VVHGPDHIPERLGKPNEGPHAAKKRSHAPLEAARRAHTTQGAHQEPEIQRCGMQEYTFEDVRVPAEVHAPHPPRFIEMGKRPFQPFAALPEQPFASRAANPSTIPVDGIASLGMVLPIAPPAIGFRDVAAHADRFEIDQLLITVIALVGDDLVEALALGHHGLDPFSGFNQRLDARGGVALIRPLAP